MLLQVVALDCLLQHQITACPSLCAVHPCAAGITPLHSDPLRPILLLPVYLAPVSREATAQKCVVQTAEGVNLCCVGFLLHVTHAGISEYLFVLPD